MMLKNVNYQKTLYVTSIVSHNHFAKLHILFLSTKFFRLKIHNFFNSILFQILNLKNRFVAADVSYLEA